MLKMFRTFRIHSLDTLSWKCLEPLESIHWIRYQKRFCCQFKVYLDFSFRIDNFLWSSGLWEIHLCSNTIFFFAFVLNGKCSFILWIWLFSPFESKLTFYMQWGGACDWSVFLRLYLKISQSDIYSAFLK